VTDALARLSLAWEILVIDDRSSDDSVAVVEAYLHRHRDLPIRLHRHDVNRGLGSTIFEAARLAGGRYFWCVAGDNPVPMETCFTLLGRVGKADIIIPHVVRYMGRTIFRRVVSRTYGTLVRLASGSTVRYFNGSSIYPREKFLAAQSVTRGFAYSAEMILFLIDQGCTYLEVPVLYTERQSGKTTAFSWRNFRDVAAFFDRLVRRRFAAVRR
jgi:glycosyltransferase involved in cell wall biosynthesis